MCMSKNVHGCHARLWTKEDSSRVQVGGRKMTGNNTYLSRSEIQRKKSGWEEQDVE